MYRFLIIIEKGNENYGAYSPDLPGCVAVGDTVEEVEKNMREAIAMHLRGMIEDQEPIPTPQTTTKYVNISFSDSAAYQGSQHKSIANDSSNPAPATTPTTP